MPSSSTRRAFGAGALLLAGGGATAFAANAPSARPPAGAPGQTGAGQAGASQAGASQAGAGQAGAASAGDWDQILIGEHRAVDALFTQLENARLPAAQRQQVAMQVKTALTRHALREENVIYPQLRLMGLEPKARELFVEHAEMKTRLAQLTIGQPGQAPWEDAVRRLIADTREHVQDEEKNVFPSFKGRMSAAQNELLSRLVRQEGDRYSA